MARKFIIQDNTLKVGNVVMHEDLKNEQSNEPVLGGGYWYIDREKNILYLYGKSIDFGRVTKKEIIEVRKNGSYTTSLEKLEWKWAFTDNLNWAISDSELIEN